MAEGKVIEFKMAANGLYCYKPKNLFDTRKLKAKEINMLNTVEERKKVFTNLQILRAYEARELYHCLGTPSVHDFKAIINMNAIRNNPVTIEDVNISEAIFGPDIGGIQGKTTR
jgi:hypothetical protein